MKEIKTCPFCGCENLVLDTEKERYICQNEDCERYVYEDDPEREDLRHKISAMISAVYGSEESPLICKEPIIIGEDEAQGLSDAEKPKVISLFHDNGGIIWLNIENYDEPKEFDWLSVNDARAIWDALTQYEDLMNKLVFF